jgi:hypothetical protein
MNKRHFMPRAFYGLVGLMGILSSDLLAAPVILNDFSAIDTGVLSGPWQPATTQESGFLQIFEGYSELESGSLNDVALGGTYNLSGTSFIRLSGRIGVGNEAAAFQIQLVEGGTIVGRVDFTMSSFNSSGFTAVQGVIAEGNPGDWDEINSINITGFNADEFFSFDFDSIEADAQTLFQIWSGNLLPGDDANNDGVTNLLSYAIGASGPNDSSARSRLIRMNTNQTVTQNFSGLADVSYAMEVSTNLVSWFPVALKPLNGEWSLNGASGYSGQANVSFSGNSNGLTPVTFTDTTIATKKFWRLVVSQ